MAVSNITLGNEIPNTLTVTQGQISIAPEDCQISLSCQYSEQGNIFTTKILFHDMYRPKFEVWNDTNPPNLHKKG